MRIRWMLIMAVALSGCSATAPLGEAGYAEIDTAVVSGCVKPSAVVRELRDARSNGISVKATPLRLPAGVYSIGVSCWTVYDSTARVCIDTLETQTRAVVPPYELLLQAGKRYVFSCSVVKDQYVVRLSEEATDLGPPREK